MKLKDKHLNMKQDVGLYTCGARNELSGRGERAKGVVYLSIEQGGRFVNNLFVIRCDEDCCVPEH